MQQSGVFAAFKLQTNYRSNQEILDFANATLDNIEANQVSKLILRSNDLTPVTEDSFKERVRLAYVRVTNIKEAETNMENILRIYAKDYVDECLARGESVTFLCARHKELNALEAALGVLWPGRSQFSIASSKSYDTNVLSRFVKYYWNDVRFLPTDTLLDAMLALMLRNIDDLEPQGRRKNSAWKLDKARSMCREWRAADTTKAAYVNAKCSLDARAITQREFFDEIRRTLFDYESKVNIEIQQNNSRKNNQRKIEAQNAHVDFRTSTIHSAKGLEFDNVVILYRDMDSMPEDQKRMYYVALTRAMKTELVLAYERHVDKSSPIVAQYNSCVANLRPAAPQATQPTATVATDDADIVSVDDIDLS